MKTKILKLAIIVGSSVGLAYLGNRLYKHRKEMLLMADNNACNASDTEVKETITSTGTDDSSPLRTPLRGIPEASKHQFTDYNKIEPVKPLEEDDDIDQDLLQEISESTDSEEKTPYLISIDDFDAGYSGRYDTVSMTYYAVDDVLADDAEETVMDVERFIGADTLDHFGAEAAELSGDENTLYVRNESLHCDYEVTRIHQSYHQVVLGE